ncbi:uncharacterized protein [Magallana gigas]|uniref:uncharacterized protein isoform X2 n=1 Tax=Magallana gigas TaxID=29159 RepID=UPI0005C3AEC8|eukprot:XP_011443798.1 PREDICTED: uncharacterized protein LOC105339775 isoform X2 [Crassostrea gigas]
MSGREEGKQEKDEEEEEDRQRMRDAARRVLQSQSEAQEDSREHQQVVRLESPLNGAPVNGEQNLQNIELPTYEEAMRITDTSVDIDTGRVDIDTGRPDSGLRLRRDHSQEENGFSVPTASYLTDKETSDKEGGDKYVVSGEEPTNSRRYSQMSIEAEVDGGHREERLSVFEVEEGSRDERDESGSRLQRFIHRRMESISFNKLCCAVILVTGVLSLIVFLGVFPASFVYLDYYQIALKYNKITGVVDRSTTYEFGCYILGPSVGFLEFDGTAHTVSKTHGVFTVDKMPITISYHVQYFLREKEVGVLHSEFGMDYDSVIRSVIESEIKNAAVPYSVDQFRLQRSVLEKYFHRKLKYRLEGDCCPACCPSSCNNFTACSLCPPPSTCSQGFHINVEYFHLGQVDIPSQVTERYLTRTLLKEYADREYFIQNKVIETTKTLRLTKQIRNTAQEIQEAANVEAQKIGVVSTANYEANLTQATISGLSGMFSTLKVTQEDHKLSLMMIRALEGVAVKGNLYRTYGYDNGTMSLYTRGMSIS